MRSLVKYSMDILVTCRRVVGRPSFTTGQLRVMGRQVVTSVNGAVIGNYPSVVIRVAVRTRGNVVLRLIVDVLLPGRISLFTGDVRPIKSDTCRMAEIFYRCHAVGDVTLRFFVAVHIPKTSTKEDVSVSPTVTNRRRRSTKVERPYRGVTVARLLAEGRKGGLVTYGDASASVSRLKVRHIPSPRGIRKGFETASSLHSLAVMCGVKSR